MPWLDAVYGLAVIQVLLRSSVFSKLPETTVFIWIGRLSRSLSAARQFECLQFATAGATTR